MGRNKPWDPYGVAKIDLSELLLGHQFLHLNVPIHNCPIPDVFPSEEREDGRSVGVMGAVDGPGLYLLSEIKKKIFCSP